MTDEQDIKQPASNPASQRPDYQNVYVALARGLDHEAKVMSDRITWAILFTGGLFTASTILMSTIVLGKPPAAIVGFLLLASAGVAAIGIVFSWTTRGGVNAAQGQFDYLRRQYRKHEEAFERLALPRPFGDRSDHGRGNFSAQVFPIVMLVSWLLIFILTVSTGFMVLGAANRDAIYRFWPALIAPVQGAGASSSKTDSHAPDPVQMPADAPGD